MIDDKNIIKELEENLLSWSESPKVQNVGFVEKNTDGVIVATGLSKSVMGERVEFKDGTSGLILNLEEDSVSIILLGSGKNIREGDQVKRTGEQLSINVSEDLLGRVIDPLGNPQDGKAKIKKGKLMPLERIAAGVVQREPVNTPMKTGIKAIDAMFPIGRGQRQLIIGDRGLGKTAIAVDTIINQKAFNKKTPTEGSIKLKPVVCVYVAIGQKRSTIAQIIGRLQETEAMDYSIVVSASASDPAALQYLAPYAGAAIAEYFMEKGQDVLVVYDDLSKHAWSYRQISLVLKRPAGREAYPGDIFYLHSRLLERAVRMNEKNGGGSITALPIIETQADDVSAYIPTNVISITDGQIYLQASLFNIGFRPAINVGTSVSRVGGSAQTSAMKSVAGKMKLELAQYAELAVFSQFGSELDPATAQSLERGKRTTEILKQGQYDPLPEAYEIISIWAVTNGHLDDVPVEKVGRFEKELHSYIKKEHPKTLASLSSGEKLGETVVKDLEKALGDFKKTFN